MWEVQHRRILSVRVYREALYIYVIKSPIHAARETVPFKVRDTKTTCPVSSTPSVILFVRVQGSVVRDVAGQPGARLTPLSSRLRPPLHQVRAGGYKEMSSILADQ